MSVDVVGQMLREGSVESLTELLAAAYGTGTKLHLYKSTFSPGPGNVEADFIAAECTFSGYAPATLTWGTVGLDGAGNAVAYSTRVEFQNSTGAVGDSVGGAWIETQTAAGPPAIDKALNFYQFAAPVPMSSALATMFLSVMAQLPDLSGKAILDT